LFRFAFTSVEDLEPLVPDAEDEYPGFRAGIEAYPKEKFWADLRRVTSGRTDEELAEVLIGNSYETVRWISEVGKVVMEPAMSLGGIRIGNVIKWPKGAIIRAVHEGVGLSKTWFATAESHGVEIRYQTGATDLIQAKSGRVTGVRVRGPNGIEEISGKAVILAAGGFEANMQMRAQYLGGPWDHAKVRGTRHNQGDGLRMALDIGAMPWGQWSGCHSTPIAAEWAQFADRKLTDRSNRLSYPYGVMLNKLGLRFVDEGEDQQFYTYAKYGGIILNQPGSLAFQIFDQKTIHLLEPRYEHTDPFTADTLDALVDQLDIDDKAQAKKTLAEYNAAAGDESKFDPSEKDGVTTTGLKPEKTNWALKLDKPPFVCYPVTGGITFTFGGLKIDPETRVIGTDWRPIPGLYTCGEMVGGLFHYNYPGGTGLVSGATFGRIAGRSAALDKG
ncbi:MAG: FAD-dependent tricarballylate dehydrogenase TcuA, partial [Rhodospirillales bacterium]